MKHHLSTAYLTGILLIALTAVALIEIGCTHNRNRPPSQQANMQTVKLMAEDWGQIEEKIVPREIFDYRAFVIITMSEKDIIILEDERIPFSRINFAPPPFESVTQSDFATMQKDLISLSSENLYTLQVLQFSGPIHEQWVTDLAESDINVVQYIYPNTLLVTGNLATALPRLQSITSLPNTDSVPNTWQAIEYFYSLESNFKIGSSLGQSYALTETVDILFYKSAQFTETLKTISTLANPVSELSQVNNIYALGRFRMGVGAIEKIVDLPSVYTIQKAPTATNFTERGEVSALIAANQIDDNNQPVGSYQNWLQQVGVNGSGVVVALVDTGSDQNNPDLFGRFLPCDGSSCGLDASRLHGTHTAGILAGTGASQSRDFEGFLSGLGVAPQASLIEQLFYPISAEPAGFLTLMTESYLNNAVISSNSWGSVDPSNGYDLNAMFIDIGVRDSVPQQAGNQELSYIHAIKNGNGGVQSQGSPDDLKNGIAVAATNAQGGSGGPTLPTLNHLAHVNAQGPAFDGRVMPHIVAPGCAVESPGNTAFPYYRACGTSQAAPHVSGAAALFVQRYRQLFGTTPSPALIKAALLATTHNLIGFPDADGNTITKRFDSKQGWGRLNIDALVNPATPVIYTDQTTILNATGEMWSQTIYPSDPSQPLQIMLVWTDAPGHGLGGTLPAWNNDLDLVVRQSANTYFGNVFDGSGWSMGGGSADYQNNTEGVFLQNAGSQAITLQVVGSNINSDGVPQVGDGTDQDFALVCINCQTAPQTEPTPTPVVVVPTATSTPTHTPSPVATPTPTATTTPTQTPAPTATPTPPVTEPLVFQAAWVWPGVTEPEQFLNFEIRERIEQIGTHTLSRTIVTTLSEHVTVLHETILVNGFARPELYSEEENAIILQAEMSFANETDLALQYSVLVKASTPRGTLITHPFESQLVIDGSAQPLFTQDVSALVYAEQIFLPLLRR